jgi:hypothetical protein
MERPWTYYLLLAIAWLAGLWGVWQIGDAWVTWPTIDAAAAREIARAKLWLAGGLIFGAAALGGLATVIRLVQDGFAQLARPVATPQAAPPLLAAVRPDARLEPKIEPKIAPPEPKPEPKLEPKREPTLEAAARLGGDASPAPRERPRPSEPVPGERREPRFLRDT